MTCEHLVVSLGCLDSSALSTDGFTSPCLHIAEIEITEVGPQRLLVRSPEQET